MILIVRKLAVVVELELIQSAFPVARLAVRRLDDAFDRLLGQVVDCLVVHTVVRVGAANRAAATATVLVHPLADALVAEAMASHALATVLQNAVAD